MEPTIDRMVGKVIIDEHQLQSRIRELAAEISRDYRGKVITLVCVLKGGLMFLTDLAKHITVPVEMDFIGISSYGNAAESSGVVRITMDLSGSIEGKHVLVVEDIIDSGLTLEFLVNNLKLRKPASLKICTLLDKPARRKANIKVDYVGFEVPNEFLVGYGLDYKELYRNVPFIFTPTKEFIDQLG